jgi:hypothetical protein
VSPLVAGTNALRVFDQDIRPTGGTVMVTSADV